VVSFYRSAFSVHNTLMFRRITDQLHLLLDLPFMRSDLPSRSEPISKLHLQIADLNFSDPRSDASRLFLISSDQRSAPIKNSLLALDHRSEPIAMLIKISR